MKDLRFAYAKKYGVLLLSSTDTEVSVGVNPQCAYQALLEIKRCSGKTLHLTPLSMDEFQHQFTKLYQNQKTSSVQMAENIEETMDLSQLIADLPKTQELIDSDDDAPIIRLLNALISEAIRLGASDIHIETFEEQLTVRFRIDGVLQEVLQPQRVLAPLITSRIKVMAKLDIAEKRLPQDGRISLSVAGHVVDIRVSTMPTGYGERIVLRLLDKKTGRLDLRELGMLEHNLARIMQLIAIPHGIILVTGPTGSGKTTTLYAALSQLNNVSRNILTVEDPIEYYLPGIGQTQVNTKVDMTFAKGLRAILRQDPDVVMVGEIRDLETAEIAVQASLTGHLVLSTLHTNSAIGVVTRLQDMGIEPFLIGSSLIGMVAQRLVRNLCMHCKEAYTPDQATCELMTMTFPSDVQFYQPKGCTECHGSGFRGRSAIYEIIQIDSTFRQLIHDKASEQALTNYARTKFPSMRQDGFQMVHLGRTSIEEVLRVTSET